jgi:hypothetical protein
LSAARARARPYIVVLPHRSAIRARVDPPQVNRSLRYRARRRSRCGRRHLARRLHPLTAAARRGLAASRRVVFSAAESGGIQRPDRNIPVPEGGSEHSVHPTLFRMSGAVSAIYARPVHDETLPGAILRPGSDTNGVSPDSWNRSISARGLLYGEPCLGCQAGGEGGGEGIVGDDQGHYFLFRSLARAR